MLKAMRKHARYFYVLFFIVILSFIFWGVGTVDKSTGVPIVEIGKWKITVEDYWTAYDRAVSLARDEYKEKFDEEMEKKLRLKEKVLAGLIEDTIILSQAEEAGIYVSDREVEEAITNDPSFKRDGTFSREIYLRILELNRIAPQYYETLKRRELIAAKMIRLIMESIDLTPSDLKGIDADEPLREEISKLLLNAKQGLALKSFIDGLSQQMNIKTNKELLPD